jgi:hypothetical protein
MRQIFWDIALNFLNRPMYYPDISERTDTNQQARQELYRKAWQLMKFNRMLSNP